MDIRLLRHGQYDRQLYNSCVHYALNGNIYGYDWYLNNTARDWDLLVEGDPYVSVLPLPRATNWRGRLELRQPSLLPELALYTVRALSPKRVEAFWRAVPDEFRKGKLTLEPLSIPRAETRFDLQVATGTNLDLSRPYEEIVADFPSDYFRDLARAEAADLLPTGTLKPERLADMYRQIHGRSKQADFQFHAMQRLMYQCLHRGWGAAYGVQTREGDVLAATFIAYSHARLFPLFQLEAPNAQNTGARTLLWDMAIHSHAERPLRIKREEVLPEGSTS